MGTEERLLRYGGLPVFFAFREGQYGYGCQRCGAYCCSEGSGIGATPEQMGARELEPLVPLVSGIRDGLFRIAIGDGGCPALSPDGACRIHAIAGRLAKPASCALFPFNILVRTEGFCAVAPHLGFRCPLVLEPGPEDTVSSWAEIIDDLERLFGGALDPFVLASAPSGGGVSLEGERRVREVVNAPARHGSLASALSEASGRSEDSLLARVRAANSLMGVDLPQEPGHWVVSSMAAIPSLRVSMYDLSLVELDAALVLGWRLSLAASPPRAAPGPRKMTGVFHHHGKLLRLLVRASRPVTFTGPIPRPRGASPEVALELALVLREVRREPAVHTLAVLLERHARSSGPDRMVLLQCLAATGLAFQ